MGKTTIRGVLLRPSQAAIDAGIFKVACGGQPPTAMRHHDTWQGGPWDPRVRGVALPLAWRGEVLRLGCAAACVDPDQASLSGLIEGSAGVLAGDAGDLRRLRAYVARVGLGTVVLLDEHDRAVAE